MRRSLGVIGIASKEGMLAQAAWLVRLDSDRLFPGDERTRKVLSFKNGKVSGRRSGHCSWAITGGLPILAATMACSLFSGGPEPTTSPSSTITRQSWG